MKVLCYLATISFLSTQAYAGTILPDLSRTKSEANTSPIAVGFSDRNSGSISYSHTSGDAEVSGRQSYDETGRSISGSIFANTSMLHMEFTTEFTDDDVDYTSATTTDTTGRTYDFGASFAMPFADTFSAGVSVNAARVTSLSGSTKGINNIITITPAIGMKFMPNMAVGVGVRHEMTKYKSITVGASVTELPNFSSNEIFAGVAYGVDQKIGENGFGVEAVISHTPKSKEQSGAIVISQGTTTSLEVNGNYTLNQLDLGVAAIYSTGDNYADTASKKAHAVIVRPEYMFMESYYAAPQLAYARVENSSDIGTDTNTTEKGWMFGLGLGHRTTKCDLELSYNHGSQDLTPGSYELDSNTFAARISFHF